MQSNQPFGRYGFQNYLQTVPEPTPQIVGEGEIAAITLPDGSVQLYFVPTTRHNSSTYPCNVNLYGNIAFGPNAEVWFVRTILHPNVNTSEPIGYYNSQLPNIFGECPPYSPFNHFKNPAYPGYSQKFHIDKWTSSTDLHYFYPSLRQAQFLQYCIETQTDVPDQNYLSQNYDCNRPCHCGQIKSLMDQKTVNFECDRHQRRRVKSSDSCMSVDAKSGETKQRKCKKHEKKPRTKFRREHFCECTVDNKDTSDKYVTTYADQATGPVPEGGRETQTEKPAKTNSSDISSGKWKRGKQKSKAPKIKVLKVKSSSGSSDSCTCSGGTSETDRSLNLYK